MIIRNLKKCTRFFLCLALICALSSCSFFSSQTSSSLDLDSVNPDWELFAVGEDDARVYRHQESYHSPLFLTAMKKCDVKVNLDKHSRSLARQLFVGLKDIRLLGSEQEQIDGQQIALSRVTGNYSGEKFYFAHYMTEEGTCLIDIVTWTKSPKTHGVPPEYIYLSQADLLSFIEFIDRKGLST